MVTWSLLLLIGTYLPVIKPVSALFGLIFSLSPDRGWFDVKSMLSLHHNLILNPVLIPPLKKYQNLTRDDNVSSLL